MAFVDGNTIKMMIPAQNYKRMHNGDKGPITEGMGAYCPCPLINNAYLELSKKEIIERAMAEFKKREIKFCGVLYARIILTETGPRVIKFNCQFGDPETEVIMPLLKNDLSEIVEACCNNQLDNIELVWKEAKSAVGIVIFNTEFTGKKILGKFSCSAHIANFYLKNVFLQDCSKRKKTKQSCSILTQSSEIPYILPVLVVLWYMWQLKAICKAQLLQPTKKCVALNFSVGNIVQILHTT